MNTELETYKGIKVQTGIKKKSKTLQKSPRRKKPIYDFDEGIRVGMLSGFIMVLQQGIKKTFSGGMTVALTIIKAKSMLEDLTQNYSYGPQEIYDVLIGIGIKNPEFMLEYIMTKGKPKERTCTVKDCVVIMTPSILIEGTVCSYHREDKK